MRVYDVQYNVVDVIIRYYFDIVIFMYIMYIHKLFESIGKRMLRTEVHEQTTLKAPDEIDILIRKYADITKLFTITIMGKEFDLCTNYFDFNHFIFNPA